MQPLLVFVALGLTVITLLIYLVTRKKEEDDYMPPAITQPEDTLFRVRRCLEKSAIVFFASSMLLAAIGFYLSGPVLAGTFGGGFLSLAFVTWVFKANL